MTKILVTGGSGLVGKSIKNLIENDGKVPLTKTSLDGKVPLTQTSLDGKVSWLFLSSKDANLMNSSEVENLFESFRPTIVIHLASKVAGLYGNMDNNYSMLIDNIKIHTNVLEACKKFKISKLINILSTCVFPDKGVVYPLTSDQIMNGAPHFSNEGYAYSKRFLLTGSELLSKSGNIKVVNLTPTNLYGENDNYNLIKSHVIPGLIHKCYLGTFNDAGVRRQGKTNDNIFFIKGSGRARRQFLYTADFAKIILHFVKSDLIEDSTSIIVSPPAESEITIRNLVDLITNEFKFEGKIIYDTDFSDGQYSKTCNDSELKRYIPDFKFTSMEDGLKSTIQYFIENFDSCDLRK